MKYMLLALKLIERRNTILSYHLLQFEMGFVENLSLIYAYNPARRIELFPEILSKNVK